MQNLAESFQCVFFSRAPKAACRPDPPSSTFPLNQLAFNNDRGGGGGKMTKDISIFFLFQKSSSVSIHLGVQGQLCPWLQPPNTPPKHPEAKSLPFYSQSINFCSEPQSIFIDENTDSLWPRFLKIKTDTIKTITPNVQRSNLHAKPHALEVCLKSTQLPLKQCCLARKITSPYEEP